MTPLRWYHRPKLRQPTLVAAFEGWNDAGDAASGAARWLADRYGAEQVARIDAEEFFDFTSTRPMVGLDDEGKRTIAWPDTEIWAAGTAGATDLVVLVGQEPHLRWRTYCAAVLEAADALDCSLVLTLGGLLSDVPHSRPTPVHGSSDDADLAERFAFGPSNYEGPTGIVGVLQATCAAAGIRSASLWATIPSYVSGAPSPKATLALVERAMTVLGIDQPTVDLQIAAAAYERQIDELIEELTDTDEDTAAWVARIAEAAAAAEAEQDGEPSDEPEDGEGDVQPLGQLPSDDEPPEGDGTELADGDPDALVEEVERFLRGD
ncbi:MAG: PAC2 family protein [Acidimicrobiales bacterium]|nr:PAC2 family protein [Acidimicrobiales bacterium]